MSDDLLTALASPPAKAPVGFRGWLQGQSPERQDAIRAAAVDARWSTSALLKTLRAAGAPGSKDSLGAFRRECGYTG